MARKVTEGVGVPYCPNQKIRKANRRGHSEKNRDKPKSICGYTAKEESRILALAKTRHDQLLAEGRATPRAKNGSYWEHSS